MHAWFFKAAIYRFSYSYTCIASYMYAWISIDPHACNVSAVAKYTQIATVNTTAITITLAIHS